MSSITWILAAFAAFVPPLGPAGDQVLEPVLQLEQIERADPHAILLDELD